MVFIKPLISGYGSSYGKYGGALLTQYAPSGDIDTTKLNKNLEVDGVQFNLFEQTVNDYVMANLGHPIVTVELTPFQLKTCIDEAVSKLDHHAPQWGSQFAVFDASAGINIYEIPQFILNNLSYAGYKRDVFGFNFTQGSIAYDMSLAFFNTGKFFQGGGIGDFFLTQQYLKIMRKVLSQEGSWSVIDNKYLQLYPAPTDTPTAVILEFRAIDSGTIHHAYRNWVQRYALAAAKGILGRVRGKYKTIPGPGGGSQMDGLELVQESKQEKTELLEELRMEIEEPPMFIIG
tara:strand:- start:19349 stop:20215 length:867 start_codon:yes stop_codon:yes gene_type:complete